ncbi:ester cyclase [Salinirubellus salinus]|uniref:Ester cyclase n=1 Tax=Salinirubellus salinus TaxID=1364945 RepID=A0A9E7R4T3_9EURY|nr:ester cyclase [Salinirubellus salinus]UWM55617.1 ester cyclase [Salinirubellus salinus]
MSSGESRPPRVAVACQGGGSHTAFTAGVLDRLLEETDVAFDVVGLSGTSGGAICAFTAWYALASESGSEGRVEARRLLRQVWDDIAVDSPPERFVNALGVGLARTQGMGVPMPSVSPYDTPASELGRGTMRRTLERAVPAADLADLVDGVDPDSPPPRLDVGAVDVQRGTFRTFTERDVTHDAVLASTAVPNLFEAAPVTEPDGTVRYYWDGLFSQNPPLGELFRATPGRLERPDELWVVQINPQREDRVPRRTEEILDRRNELGGNLSINQELEFVRLLNEAAAAGETVGAFRPIAVKTVELDESMVSPDRSLDYATKLDRSHEFLDQLWDHGREQAGRFLAVERDRRTVQRAVREVWNEGEADWDGLVAPSLTVHSPSNLVEVRRFLAGESEAEVTPYGLAEYVSFTRTMREAIPDLSFRIEETAAEPDRVAIRWRATGTNTGPFLGTEPSDRPVSLSGMSMLHLDDGKITTMWTLYEGWGLLRQVGVADVTERLSTTARVAATPVVTQLSAPTENRDIVDRLTEAVWNRGDRDALDRVLAADSVLYLDSARELRGRDAYWKFVQRYREGFPDLRLTVEETVSEGDKVFLRQRLRGTHDGRFLDVEPTGETVDVARMVVHHVDDGRIVETGVVEDTIRLLHQLGVTASAEVAWDAPGEVV